MRWIQGERRKARARAGDVASATIDDDGVAFVVAATCAAASAIVAASLVVVRAIDTCALPVRAP